MPFDRIRRELLKGLGALGALWGTPVGALAEKIAASRDPFPQFDHVVVLMLENRSFDNVFGYLYDPKDKPRFEGVLGKKLSNPIPAGAQDAHRKRVPVSPTEVMDDPNPDPGEDYSQVNKQMYGGSNNGEAPIPLGPHNLPRDPPATPPMSGFVADYIHVVEGRTGRKASYDEYRKVMQCFPPTAIPVLSTLAREFAVCDRWFCDVPSSTFPNRSFFNAASSAGLLVNTPLRPWLRSRRETIFNRMSDRGVSWNVYYDHKDALSITELIHFHELKDTVDRRFKDINDFYEDAEKGTLPQYSFLEPRFFVDNNDAHPPMQPRTAMFGGPSSVLAAEVLVHRVYDAVRRSASATGSNARNTLLVITFDEHGGCFDHVPPPKTVPPDDPHRTGQMGFGFDRLGLRVPTVLVSAYVEPGTVVGTPLQHTSVIRTMSDKWALGHLTERDRTAPSLRDAFNRKTPRSGKSWPITRPKTLHPYQKPRVNLDEPLNELQSVLVSSWREAAFGGVRGAQDLVAMTVSEGVTELARIKRFMRRRAD